MSNVWKQNEELAKSYADPTELYSISNFSEMTKPMSSTSKLSQTKSKLYMRMVIKLTEKFGNNPKTVNIIKKCLDENLEGKAFINANILEVIENDI